ncbi:MAG: hypothetical protein IKN38_01285 [Clostridia bacterium]|nr:hypothetical protein [Clostridia bacterium]
MIKRLFASLILISLLTVSAAAGYEDVFPEETFYNDMASVEAYTEELGITEHQYEQLKNVVYGATRNCREVCDVSNFNLKSNQTVFGILNNFIRKGDPLTFHIEAISVTSSGTGSDKKIKQLKFVYKYTSDVYYQMRDASLEVAQKLLEGVKDNTWMSDVQKALVLHDRLAVLCEYDTDNFYAGTLTDNDYSIYGAFVDRKCVCEGYTKAYSYLLDEVGIDNYYCDSYSLGHMWNIVYIDGVKYHVDVTWDDPVSDVTGYVTHEYFLCSTDKMKSSDHNATDYDDSPVATTYDNEFWGESNSSFIPYGGSLYYINNAEAALYEWSGSERTKLLDLVGRWRAPSGGLYIGNFSCLGSDGTNMFYSLPDKIMRYDPESGRSSAVYVYDPADNASFRIYGFTAEEGVFTIDVYSSPNFTEDTKDLYQFTTPYDLSSVKRGDADGDGMLSLKDIAALKGYLAGAEGQYDVRACDSNEDGVVNLMDLSYLKQMIAG